MSNFILTDSLNGAMWYGDAFNGTLDDVDMALLGVMNSLEKYIEIQVYDSLTTNGVWVDGVDIDAIRDYTSDCCDDVDFDDYQDIEIKHNLQSDSIEIDWFAYDEHLFHIEMYWTDRDVQELIDLGR